MGPERAQIPIPPLQIPMIEKELLAHRAVLAENGVGWHLDWRVDPSPYAIYEAMPAQTKGLMLMQLAQRRQEEARIASVDGLSHIEEVRRELRMAITAAHTGKEHQPPSEYLEEVLSLSIRFADLGFRLSASSELRSAIFFATKNGRTVDADLEVRAAIALAKLCDADHRPRDALMAIEAARETTEQLSDSSLQKAEWYRVYATIAFRAGYLLSGAPAAQVASRLLQSADVRDRLVPNGLKPYFWTAMTSVVLKTSPGKRYKYGFDSDEECTRGSALAGSAPACRKSKTCRNDWAI